MATKSYLLTWNPKRFPWSDLSDNVAELNRRGTVSVRWSCGNTKNIQPGSAVYLLRQGIKPTGIMGSGYALCAPFKEETWNASKSNLAQYIDVRMLSLLDPSRDGVLDTASLAGVLKTVNWRTQSSGIEIKNEAAVALARRWGEFLTKKGLRLGSWYSAAQYAAALQRLAAKVTNSHRTLLIANANALGHFLTNGKLAKLLGKTDSRIIHSQYGRLGRLLGEAMGHKFERKEIKTRIIADDGRSQSGDFGWTMEPALARALIQLGWATGSDSDHADEGVGVSSEEREIIGGSKAGQGFEPDPKVRHAVERRAMEVARAYYQKLGYRVTDTSLQRPYDYILSKNGKERRVEVKGTRGTCFDVILTAGEVNAAQSGPEQTDLFVVSEIKVTKRNGKVSASRGRHQVFTKWKPSIEDLAPTEYRYRLPVSKNLR